jgi:O-acetylhomoserine (thiol)-lyase
MIPPRHRATFFRRAGAVATFGIRGGYEADVTLVNNMSFFSHSANVGDTRSLINHLVFQAHCQLRD